MNQALFPPAQVTLKRADATLEICWRNGVVDRIPAATLRQFCACSGCRAAQRVGWDLLTSNRTVEKVAAIGSGLQIIFGDGHDRGIYPWEYLRAIATGQAKQFLYG